MKVRFVYTRILFITKWKMKILFRMELSAWAMREFYFNVFWKITLTEVDHFPFYYAVDEHIHCWWIETKRIKLYNLKRWIFVITKQFSSLEHDNIKNGSFPLQFFCVIKRRKKNHFIRFCNKTKIKTRIQIPPLYRIMYL